MKKPDDASAFVASGEGTSPERGGGDSENAVRSRPRTSLGDGVVKPVGSRIEWAQLLRRIYWVDVLACPCGGRRAIVADLPGKGPVDEARDGVACVSVFRDNAASVAGKHPFDDAWLAELAADSNWLLEQLRISGAKVDKPAKSADSLVRDQLFTEIVRRYGQGKKVAVERWGWKRVDEHYPSLFAREVAAPGAAAAPAAPIVAAGPAVKPDP